MTYRKSAALLLVFLGCVFFLRNSRLLPTNFILLEAAASGNTKRVGRALALGANVNGRASKWNRYESPLHNAALAGHVDTVEMLLPKGADINANTDEGSTPLSYAVLGGNEGVVALLLQNGADQDAMSIHGATPLILAARDGHKAQTGNPSD